MALLLALLVYTGGIFALGFGLGFGLGWFGAPDAERTPAEEDPWLFRPHLVVDNTPKDAA